MSLLLYIYYRLNLLKWLFISPRVSKLVILKFVLIVLLLHLLKMGLLLIENNNFIVKHVRNGASIFIQVGDVVKKSMPIS